jgi:phosphonoacetaldehyde hydrolase
MVFVDVFKRQGVEIAIEEARVPMGKAKRDHILEITQMPAVIERWQSAHGREPNEADVDTMYEMFIPLQLETMVNYADPIPGTLEAMADFKQRGLKIGSNTGYNREMVELLLVEAKKRGYEPDSTVCASDVPAGRPEPWMSLLNAQEMGVFPMEAIVKIDDTIPGIDEGLNAGMWTIGFTKSGNEFGLSEAEVNALPPDVLQAKLDRATQRMVQAGAHYVVEGIWEVSPVLDKITARLAKGEKP